MTTQSDVTWRALAVLAASAILYLSSARIRALPRPNRIHTGCGWLAPPPRAQVPTVCAEEGTAAETAAAAS